IPKVKIYISRADGKIEERYYTLKSNYIEIEGNKVESIISLADITREVEIERMKDDFISIASHELKTPVSIVKNNLWMMKNSSGLTFDNRSRRYISEMEQGLERLRKLVDELLNASRIDQNRLILDLKEADADTLVAESLDNFIETIKFRNIELVQPQKTNSKVMIDIMKFQQVVDNFISNAIKYCNPQNPRIIIETKIEDTLFVFQITDNGPGIAKEDYPKMFTKFGRATEGLKLISPGTSTGLGLYISKNFIEAMKGHIGFTSKVGEGSTFWFKIPLHKNKDNTVVTTLS
ncbi:MAG: two-component system, OmpR family, phosphate regulon sensor histidine kinase PhoR, partial [Patescibacteria group bacterium]|nr:two-component system, OmpR family, phosphate regulon sensor histidine kinase PhoR [Patescibacteria group bacterium]